jgi:hypothetical protein
MKYLPFDRVIILRAEGHTESWVVLHATDKVVAVGASYNGKDRVKNVPRALLTEWQATLADPSHTHVLSDHMMGIAETHYANTVQIQRPTKAA